MLRNLLDCLKGDAADVVKGFTLSAASYREAIKLLKEEYGDKTAIIQSHLDALYKLQVRAQVTNTDGLKQMYLDIMATRKIKQNLRHIYTCYDCAIQLGNNPVLREYGLVMRVYISFPILTIFIFDWPSSFSIIMFFGYWSLHLSLHYPTTPKLN